MARLFVLAALAAGRFFLPPPAVYRPAPRAPVLTGQQPQLPAWRPAEGRPPEPALGGPQFVASFTLAAAAALGGFGAARRAVARKRGAQAWLGLGGKDLYEPIQRYDPETDRWYITDAPGKPATPALSKELTLAPATTDPTPFVIPRRARYDFVLDMWVPVDVDYGPETDTATEEGERVERLVQEDDDREPIGKYDIETDRWTFVKPPKSVEITPARPQKTKQSSFLEIGVRSLKKAFVRALANPEEKPNRPRPLLVFAAKGDVVGVQRVLETQGDPNVVFGTFEDTPLHKAAKGGHVDAARLLVDYSASIDAANARGYTPLMTAARWGREDMVAFLLSTGAYVDEIAENGDTALILSVRDARLGVVRQLLEFGASTESMSVRADMSEQGQSALLNAARIGQPEVVELLLSAGADPFFAGPDGTALEVAARVGDAETTEVLLRALNAETDSAFFQSDAARRLAEKKATDSHSAALRAAARRRHAGALQVLLAGALSPGAVLDVRDARGMTPLMHACKEGAVEVAQHLVDAKAAMDLVPDGKQIEGAGDAADRVVDDRWPVLVQAAFRGHEEVCRVLLDSGADVDAASIPNGGMTPLMQAAIAGRETVVDLLLDRRADMDQSNANGFSAVMLACRYGRAGIVAKLLAMGADTNARKPTRSGGDNKPLMRLASSYGHTAAVRVLLDAGLDAVPESGAWSPLHAAASRGHLAVVDQLLDASADVDITDKESSLKGKTPLHVAAGAGHSDIALSLMNAKAAVDAPDTFGRIPLSFAAFRGHQVCCELLLAEGGQTASPDAPSMLLESAAAGGHAAITEVFLPRTGGDTSKALAAACKSGSVPVAELLLGAGASVDAMVADNKTPLMHASTHGHADIVRLLIGAEAAVDKKNCYGLTALMYAAKRGHSDAVEALVCGDANREVADIQGRTAAEYAGQEGHRDVQLALGAAESDLCSLPELDDVEEIGPQESAAPENIRGKMSVADALAEAAYAGNPVTVRRLLSHPDADVNAQGSAKGYRAARWAPEAIWTPLMSAALRGHREVAQLLLDEGADVNTENQHGYTALSYAAKSDAPLAADVGELLIAAGAAVDAPNKYGHTPLMRAANWGRKGMVQVLLDASANTAATAGARGRTALHRAAYRGHFEICRLLLEANAPVDALCGDEKNRLEHTRTPLLDAAADGYAEVVQVLLAGGANPSGSPLATETPLAAAARGKHPVVGALLLRAGADAAAAASSGVSYEGFLREAERLQELLSRDSAASP